MSFAPDRSIFLACALSLAACGGAPPQAAAPPPAPNASAPQPATGPSVELEMPQGAPEAEASSAPADPQPPPAAPAPSAATPAASNAPAAETASTRRPIDVLTGPNVAFIVDYQNSQPYEAAQRTCESEAAEARGECMQKARAAFRADVLYFKKDAQGRFWLTVYERKGSALPELFKARVEFSDETASSVTLRLKEEKGTRPIFAGAGKIVVSVPSDYGLELNDPKHGRLVYGAKVGLVGDR